MFKIIGKEIEMVKMLLTWLVNPKKRIIMFLVLVVFFKQLKICILLVIFPMEEHTVGTGGGVEGDEMESG